MLAKESWGNYRSIQTQTNRKREIIIDPQQFANRVQCSAKLSRSVSAVFEQSRF
jgi:hypothetical protein